VGKYFIKNEALWSVTLLNGKDGTAIINMTHIQKVTVKALASLIKALPFSSRL
jgi:hypothetical protein